MKNDARIAPEDVRRFASHSKEHIGTSEKNTLSFALITSAIHGVITAPPRISNARSAARVSPRRVH